MTSSSSSSWDVGTRVHTKQIIADISRGWSIDDVGCATKYPIEFWAYDSLNMQINCVDHARVPVDVSGYDFLLGIGTDFTHSGADLVRCTEVETHRAASGELMFDLECPSFSTYLGTLASKLAWLCVWAIDPGDADNPQLLLQCRCTIKASVGDIHSEINESSSSSSDSSSSDPCPNIFNSITADVHPSVDTTFRKYVNVTVDGESRWLTTYTGELTGIVDGRVLYGDTATDGIYVANDYAVLTVNGDTYYTPVYTGDAGVGCRSIMTGWSGSAAAVGFVMVNLNDTEYVYVPLYQ